MARNDSPTCRTCGRCSSWTSRAAWLVIEISARFSQHFFWESILQWERVTGGGGAFYHPTVTAAIIQTKRAAGCCQMSSNELTSSSSWGTYAYMGENNKFVYLLRKTNKFVLIRAIGSLDQVVLVILPCLISMICSKDLQCAILLARVVISFIGEKQFSFSYRCTEHTNTIFWDAGRNSQHSHCRCDTAICPTWIVIECYRHEYLTLNTKEHTNLHKEPANLYDWSKSSFVNVTVSPVMSAHRLWWRLWLYFLNEAQNIRNQQ